MLPIKELTASLQAVLTATKIKILLDIIECFFSIRYGITTRGLARYSEYSLRTFFRFLKNDFNWIEIRMRLFKSFIYSTKKTYIVAVDEVVEGKSRTKSYGLHWFFSSIIKQPIRGICFFALTLIDVETGFSYSMGIHQVVYTDKDKARIATEKANKKAAAERKKNGESRPKGRKKGTKNKVKEENDTASYRAFKALWTGFWICLKKILPNLTISHLVADSAYGTQDYLELAKGYGSFLISRMCSDAALYLPYKGVQKGKKPKMYGDKIKFDDLDKYLKNTEEKDDVIFTTYQFEAYSKSILVGLLNIVVVKAYHKKDKKYSHHIWFSNDLGLTWETMLRYYKLRFQIEFDFRDAKQHFGFSDFKNYKEQNLTNFVNLSFLMVLVSKVLLGIYREKLTTSKLSVLDLKIIFSSHFTAKNVLKLIRKSPESIFSTDFLLSLVPEDLINTAFNRA